MDTNLTRNRRMNVATVLLFTMIFLTGIGIARAQRSEIGFSVVLSGHILFGPYYRLWLDDHNELETNVMAAWETRFFFPSALNVGYRYYFLENHWRPSAGAQCILLIGPKVAEENYKRRLYPLFCVVPGVQYRWNDTHLSAEELMWVSIMKSKGKVRVFPIGLETRAGYKW